MSSHSFALGTLLIPGELASVKIARDLVAAVVKAAGLDEDTGYVAKMATSELVGNAAQHAMPGSPVSVGIDRVGDLLRVEVHDTSKEAPAIKRPDGLAEGGYGLWLVDDIADDFGFHFTATGKAVWFSLKTTWPTTPTA